MPNAPCTLLFVALIAGSGCFAQLEPVVAMRGRGPAVEMRLLRARFSRTRTFFYEVNAAAPLPVQNAHLTVPEREPCTGGAEAVQITVDGHQNGGEVPQGRHELGVDFEALADRLDVVVDLATRDGRCIRAAAISQSLPFVAPKRVSLVSNMLLDAVAGGSGLQGLYGAQLGAGGWLGPLLVTASAGVGAAQCTRGVCGNGSNDSYRSGFAVPITFDVQYALPGALWHPSPFALLMGIVGARYSVVPFTLPALGGDRRFTAHEIQATFSVGSPWTALPRGPFEYLERVSRFEIVVPVGIALIAGANDSGPAFTAGLGLRSVFPL